MKPQKESKEGVRGSQLRAGVPEPALKEGFPPQATGVPVKQTGVQGTGIRVREKLDQGSFLAVLVSILSLAPSPLIPDPSY